MCSSHINEDINECARCKVLKSNEANIKIFEASIQHFVTFIQVEPQAITKTKTVIFIILYQSCTFYKLRVTTFYVMQENTISLDQKIFENSHKLDTQFLLIYRTNCRLFSWKFYSTNIQGMKYPPPNRLNRIICMSLPYQVFNLSLFLII